MSAYFDTGISDASFEGVAFPVEGAAVDEGNDVVEHVALGRPGADIEPTGRKASRGTLSVPFTNTPAFVARYGTMLPDLYDSLVGTFRRTPIGTLVHPTLGPLTAAIVGWSKRITTEQRDGWTLEVSWVEHNATASVLVTSYGALADPDPAGDVASQASAADASMAAADPTGATGYTPLSPTMDTGLAALQGEGRTATEQAATLDAMLAAVDADRALFGDAEDYATVDALESLRSAVLALRAEYLPAGASRLYVVPVTMALWQVAQAVYQDASRDGLLAAANAIPDPLAVPAGTVLVVPSV